MGRAGWVVAYEDALPCGVLRPVVVAAAWGS